MVNLNFFSKCRFTKEGMLKLKSWRKQTLFKVRLYHTEANFQINPKLWNLIDCSELSCCQIWLLEIHLWSPGRSLAFKCGNTDTFYLFFNFKQMSWFSKTTGASNNWKRQFSVQCTCSYFWAGHNSVKWVVAFLLAGSLLTVRQNRKHTSARWRRLISVLNDMTYIKTFNTQPKRVMILAKT